MKFLTMLLLATFSFVSLANELEVTVEQDYSRVRISVETETRSSMCLMKATELIIKKPTSLEEGLIDVKFESDYSRLCSTAFGPHRGHLDLFKGNDKIQLKIGGIYKLRVNGATQRKRVKVQ